MSEESKGKIYLSHIVFIICFVIGCLFLYWAVEYYVYNTFDHDRYALAKIQVNGTDSLSVWKIDQRTGTLEYCTKSYDKIDHFVCVRAVNIDAKEYTPPVEPTKPASEEVKPTPETTKPAADAPVSSSSATTGSTPSKPAASESKKP